jgi:hypothetical protein
MATFEERERAVEEMLRRRARRRRLIIVAVVLCPLAVLAISGWLYDWYWQRKVEAKLSEFRAAGQPVTWQEVLAARPVPPDEENSALVMLKAFGQFRAFRNEAEEGLVLGSAGGKRDGRKHSVKTRKMASAYLADNAAVLDLIASAAALPGGAYPPDTTGEPWEMLLPHLASLREAARLCGVAAAYRAEAGDPAGALRALTDGRTAIQSIGQPMTLIEALVRIAMNAIWADSLQRVLEVGELPPAALRELRGQAEAEQKAFSMEMAWYAERAMGHSAFATVTDPATLSGGTGSALWHIYRLVPGWSEQDALFYYTFWARQVSISALPIRERLAESRKLGEETGVALSTSRWRHPMSGMLMPAVTRATQEEVRSHVRMSIVRAALAAEEWRLAHGRWPDSLDDLVPGLLDAVPEDPFSEGTVCYLKTANGVVVYSVGQDGQDDGGLTESEAHSRAGPRQVPSTFDESFHLLDQGLRGVGETTFPEDAAAAGLRVRNLLDAGFTQDELRTLGFPESELQPQD